MSINNIIDHISMTEEHAIRKDLGLPEEKEQLNDKVREYAERIFFERYLKEINPGMNFVKIRGRIARAVETAKALYEELYRP
ncbi:MAG: hypothetical protein V8T07_00565 [Muribaculaceae bacterium]